MTEFKIYPYEPLFDLWYCIKKNKVLKDQRDNTATTAFALHATGPASNPHTPINLLGVVLKQRAKNKIGAQWVCPQTKKIFLNHDHQKIAILP